jgi:peptide/nickel transport system substrate-binding protein
MQRPPEKNPKYGGTLKTAWPIAVPHFDMHQRAQSYSGMTNFYNNLMYFNAEDGFKSFIPDLAASWSLSADGKSYTFLLREGVKWHDGKPFTSADVEATYNRILNPPDNISVELMTSTFEPLESVEAPDDLTIVMRLKRPTPWFIELVGADPNFGPAVIYPKHVLDANNQDLRGVLATGTGPFMSKEHKPGELWIWEPNPNYWNPALPFIDQVKQFHIKAGSDRGTAVLTGRADIAWNGSVGTWAEAASQPNKFIVGNPPNLGISGLWLNNEKKPFNDVRVRRALFLALDKHKWVEIISSVGIPYYVGRWQHRSSPYAQPPGEYGDIPGWRKPTAGDLAEAKALMVEAGYPDGLKTTITAINQPTRVEVIVPFIAASLKDTLNIDVEIKVIERALSGETLAGGNWEAFSGESLGSLTQDPTPTWNSGFRCGGGNNFMNYCNPEADKILDMLLAELDPVKRQDLANQMMDQLDKDAPFLIHGGNDTIPLAQRFVAGLSIEDRGRKGWMRFETVWLDK